MPRLGLGHWFRNLDSLKNIIKKTLYTISTTLTFYIYASGYKLKKSSKSKFGAEFVATITDFGEAKKFFKNTPQHSRLQIQIYYH